jgi:Na+/H+ antiporter NhaC
MALIIVGIVWFFFASAIQSTQEAVNPQLASTNFNTAGNWATFNLANEFMNNIWTYFLVFLILGLAYYGYNEAQRRT